MDPSQATKFIDNLDRSPTFRKKFGGLYVPMIAALERLGGSDRGTPAFIEEKLIKIRTALKEEERLLNIMRAKVSAREARAEVLRSALDSEDKRDWESVIWFESWLPHLPPRPPVRRARRKPKIDESARESERLMSDRHLSFILDRYNMIN